MFALYERAHAHRAVDLSGAFTQPQIMSFNVLFHLSQ